MNLTERVSVSAFMTDNPEIFWALICAGWGAIYAAIVTVTIVVYVNSKRILRQSPALRPLILFVQLVWAVAQLLGVFAIPWLIGALDKTVLNSSYAYIFLLSLAVSLFANWYLCRHSFSFADLK
jgi:hypothetical protein